MADTLPLHGVQSQSDPAIGAIAITGSDQTIGRPARGVYVATDGDLACTMADGTTPTFVGLKAGAVYPFAIVAITDAGTSITGHVLV
jgi:hypothetical protein